MSSGPDARGKSGLEPANDDDYDMGAGDGVEPQRPRKLIVDPMGEIDLAKRRDRYNVAHIPETFPDEDPMSPLYARADIGETAGSILYFWFANTVEKPSAIPERVKFWFGGGFDLDRIIAQRFVEVLAKLASGEARRWAEQSPRGRLAAIVALDQFSRSIFRGTAAAFENDALALQLAKEAMASGIDRELKPVERWFLLMPFEHSESASDQRRAIEGFTALLPDAPPEATTAFESALDYAKRHAAVIRKFGRFPHRNAALGRTSTTAEKAFLKKPGSSF